MPRLALPVLALFLTFPLTGCSPVVEDSSAVSGTIVDSNGAPIVGATVQLGDVTMTTDDEGHFEAAAASGPYDLTIRPTERENAWIFLGLVDHEPTIRLLGTTTPIPVTNSRSTDIVVTLPEKDDDTVVSRTILDVLDKSANGVSESDNPASPLEKTTTLFWADSMSSKARFQAFRYTVDPVTRAPKHYVGYDSAEVTLTSGVPAAWAVSWKVPPFGESTVSFDVHRSSPPGALFAALRMQSAGAQFTQDLAREATSGSEVSFVVPDLAGASFTTLVSTSESGSPSSIASVPGLVAGMKGSTVELPPYPVLTSPKEGDTLGPGSEIKWSAEGKRASLVSIVPVDFFSHDPRYVIATEGSSVVVPDLGRLGLHLPSGAKYEVKVERDSWTPTVDDVAATPWAAIFATRPFYIVGSALPEVVIQ